jgi:type IV pilus assembly protein PilC
MLYKYKAVLNTGESREGTIEAGNVDFAISFLQNKGLVISSIKPADEKNLLNINISFFDKVSTKDVVILSRQLATLFEAQVSALRIFQILANQSDNKALAKHLAEVANDIQGGMSISKALSKHPDIFSDFYVNMVLAGEESGKLNDTFNFLADYMDRTYEVVSKAKNALIYPMFVIMTFIGVMILMFTVIIPKIAVIIKDSNQEVPIYTKVVLYLSDFFIHYGLYLAVAFVLALVAIWRYVKTKEGANYLAYLKLSVPYVGNLYRKLYLSISFIKF